MYSNFYARAAAVSALTILELGRWGILTALNSRIDDLQLKLWLDELTWRTAFGQFSARPDDDWDETIRQSTVLASEDIKSVRFDADLLSTKTPAWVSVPLKAVFKLAMILLDVVIVLVLLPFFKAFVEPASF